MTEVVLIFSKYSTRGNYIPVQPITGCGNAPSGAFCECKRPPNFSRGGLGDLLSSIMGNLDTGDIILILILLLLYMDSRDEEYLIILAVIMLS